ALASVLGVGEGHLLHRETRWVGSRYFAKSESLFQSFPRLADTATAPRMRQSEQLHLRAVRRPSVKRSSNRTVPQWQAAW
ncbi:hypothetical protein, partial [Pseudomonas putida]|uniref:hypothetical protein n=1 Tax=Pseudomonas putida TaxID=303 RepID=UPI003CC7FC7F